MASSSALTSPVNPFQFVHSSSRNILPLKSRRSVVSVKDDRQIFELSSPSKDTRSLANMDVDLELAEYLKVMHLEDGTSTTQSLEWVDELKTAPLFTWAVKTAATAMKAALTKAHSSSSTKATALQGQLIFSQYALLGRELKSADRPTRANPDEFSIFLNTNAPWSAFICGSQGSGKSYTLSCILENTLLQSNRIGQTPNPLGGILFHYDAHHSGGPCEAAYIATHIPVTVLVSPSNFWAMTKVYSKIPAASGRVKVIPLQLKDKHLNTQRMLRLMAFSEKDGSMPLYMECIITILKKMARESKGAPGLNYKAFLTRLKEEQFARDQKGPLNLRLQLLDWFMESSTDIFSPAKGNIFKVQPGTLTIVDLSDPFVDSASACVLFDICLALFLEDQSGIGRIIALDEAHKFMSESAASGIFTESLLQVIREQRHKGARVVVATQEPTISTKLLDLCSMTIVHRFTSPEWLSTLKDHLAGASRAGGSSKEDLEKLFEEIVNLNVGESLLFSPSAMLDIASVESADSSGKLSAVEERIVKLGMGHVKLKTRPRLTADGGKSIMASGGMDSSESDSADNDTADSSSD